MVPARLRPRPEQRSEMPSVPCDEDPLLLDRELKDLRIDQTIELGMFRKREHVVAGGPQRFPDPLRGDMSVQEQAHLQRALCTNG